MKKHLFLYIFLLSVGLVSSGFAQETQHVKEKENETDHGHHKKHIISASINHTVIFSGVKEGEKTSLALPSFGLNYTYEINEKWGVGLHTDIILEDFVVKETASGDEAFKSSEEEIAVIERGTPLAVAIVAIYKPVPFLGLIAGAGKEFSEHEDFALIRFGIEVPYHFANNWLVFGVVTYDINIDAYHSLTYGVGIGKLF